MPESVPALRLPRAALLPLLFTALALPALPAAALPVAYTATLSGAAEASPNASPGTGFATLTADAATKLLRITVDFSGLNGTTTMAHVHCCTAVPRTGNIGVATATPSFPGFPLGVTGGFYDADFTLNAGFLAANGGTLDSAFVAFVAGLDSGRAYLNIHSTAFPGGEIRGFFDAAAVPEPASAWLAVAALGALGATTARRRATPRG